MPGAVALISTLHKGVTQRAFRTCGPRRTSTVPSSSAAGGRSTRRYDQRYQCLSGEMPVDGLARAC